MRNGTNAVGAVAFSLLMISSMIVGGVAVSAGEVTAQSPGLYAGGDGTVDDPYKISNWTHLNNTRQNLDANFTLVSELNESLDDYDDHANETANSEKGWIPIGKDPAFTGSLNGSGYAISGLFINRTEDNEVGLFGEIGSSGSVEHVAMTDVQVTGNAEVGGLVGRFKGDTISDTSVTGTVTSTVTGDARTGGLAGVFSGTEITDSSADVHVRAPDGEQIGGLVGQVIREDEESFGGYKNTLIAKSSATGAVHGSDRVGGLVGQLRNKAQITDSTASGYVNGSGNIGGLVGYSYGNVSYSTATGDANGTNYVGGLVGYMDRDGPDPVIVGSTASGNVDGEDYVGGALGGTGRSGGGSTPIRIEDTTATGTVTGENYTGGLAGELDNRVDKITDSDADGTVSGVNYVGGLVGWNLGTVSSSTVSGQVTGTDYVGGIAGFAESDISGVTVTNDVTGANYTGGIVGEYGGGTVELTDATSTGTVSGDWYVGGLIGDMGSEGISMATVGTISSSEATGAVDGEAYVGGLVGNIDGNVSASIAEGDITGTDWVGGLVGYIERSSSSRNAILDSTASGDTTGQEYVGGVLGGAGGKPTTLPILVKNTTAQGDVAGTGDDVGGLIGELDVSGDEVVDSEATGGVEGANNVGGLIGKIVDGVIITRGYATGAVSGDTDVGGLIGNASGNITTSYATGATDGTGAVGGLVGTLTTTGSVDEVYAAGAVSGDSDVGGLIGTSDSTSVTDAYWDTETTGQETSAGTATGVPTDQLKGDTTQNTTAFDFTSTWDVVDNSSYVSYPYLRANTQEPAPGLTKIDTGSTDRTAPTSSGGGGKTTQVSVQSSTTATDSTEGATVTLENVNSVEPVSIDLTDASGGTDDGETAAEPQTLRNVLADGLDITIRRSGDYDLRVTSRDIDVFAAATGAEGADTDRATPDLSTAALDTESRQFVEATTQRPVGFITVDHGFEESDVETATHEFRVRKTYLAATGASVESVRLYRQTDETYQELPTRQTTEDDEFYYFEADTPGFSTFVIGTAAPVFSVESATVDSFDETTGAVDVSATVENVGSASGEFVLPLVADDETIGSQMVSLSAGESTVVTVSAEVTGESAASLSIAGESLGEVGPVTQSAPSTEETSEPASTDSTGDAEGVGDESSGSLDILGILVPIGALALVLFFILWRRRDDEADEDDELSDDEEGEDTEAHGHEDDETTE